jgi:hypothetical protein
VLVNKRLPNCTGFLTRDALVRGIVMPHIVREVLPRAVRSEQQSDKWVRKWLEFASKLVNDEPPDEYDADDADDAIDRWVDEVVTAFADSFKFSTSAEVFLNKSEDV